MATSAKFLAAERTIEGPPMSMFSMTSANATPGLLRGLLEGVEIHDDHVDGLDGMLVDRGHVLRVVANVQDAAVDLGVERLDAAVEHLGEAGQVADVADCRGRRRAVPGRCLRWRPVLRRGRRGRGRSRRGRSCR